MKVQATHQIITGTVMVYKQSKDGEVEEVCIQTGNGNRLIPLLTSVGETTKPLIGKQITVLCDMLGRDYCGNPVIEIKEIQLESENKLCTPLRTSPLRAPLEESIY